MMSDNLSLAIPESENFLYEFCTLPMYQQNRNIVYIYYVINIVCACIYMHVHTCRYMHMDTNTRTKRWM
jgi:NADH:ubiquinone oxidoreductase subunit 4 (subunit M)